MIELDKNIHIKKKQSKTLRVFRKIHRTTAIFLFSFFLFISISGLMLGWKKNSNEYIMPKTYQGSSTEISDWLSVDSLHTKAIQVLIDSVSPNLSTELSKIDFRHKNGIVKFIFKNHIWEVQLDCSTAEVLSLGKRRSDFIESIHDGSIVDNLLGFKHGQFKLIYTSLSGLALLVFTITGFWLWRGTKRLKKVNHKMNSK